MVWARLTLAALMMRDGVVGAPACADLECTENVNPVRQSRSLIQRATKSVADAAPNSDFEAFLDPSKASGPEEEGAEEEKKKEDEMEEEEEEAETPPDSPAVATVGATELIPFCSAPERSVWKRLCSHWAKALEVEAFKNGKSICCTSLPSPCASIETCSYEDDCLVPSCDQEEWYLQSIEMHSDEAFGIFGLTTPAFRQCGFAMEETTCGQSDADFGMTEASVAALTAFVKLDGADFEATAWEIVSDLVIATQTSGDSGALVESMHRRAVENGNVRTETVDKSLRNKATML